MNPVSLSRQCTGPGSGKEKAVETFAPPKALVDHHGFKNDRDNALAGLKDHMIDAPIAGIIQSLNALPCCFTLQCCFGHFVTKGQSDEHNLKPLPIADDLERVQYRLAYFCVCIENSDDGRALLADLKQVPLIDPENIQLCSADWFWERQVNTYSLQVMPDRFKDRDSTLLDYTEALAIEKVRNRFFEQIRKRLQNRS